MDSELVYCVSTFSNVLFIENIVFVKNFRKLSMKFEVLEPKIVVYEFMSVVEILTFLNIIMFVFN